MAVTHSVAIMLMLNSATSVDEKEAVCKRDSNQPEENDLADKCSLSMLQVDSKRQEYASFMSQQQRAEVNSAMFELHHTLHAHPKVAKQALHEVLLDMGAAESSHAGSGHKIVAAKSVHRLAQPPIHSPMEPPMVAHGQLSSQALNHESFLLKARLMQPSSTVAPAENPQSPPADKEEVLEPDESPQAPAAQGAKIAPFGKEDTASELTEHAERTQDTLVDAVENAEVAEVKRAVFRALTRLRAASIKEFDTIARLETQAIDEYNDAHHYRVENPLNYIHSNEPKVKEDKFTSFH